MFGNYSRSLDEKRRVIVPSKFRNALGKTFYITLGADNTLDMRTSNDFEVWMAKINGTNMLSKDARKFARILLGNTIKLEFDKQGRIALPNTFLQKTGITTEVTFVGIGNKVELWDSKRYLAFEKEFASEGAMDKLADKLLKDGFEL
ncbi:MAG: division/cell wall cluster transcriptional repressor MraZ [Mycoplasmataceae bacterium]|nr:division/cell wall cluster transcriptional repressor MraZ [Mycoplasmataceae bacterium]